MRSSSEANPAIKTEEDGHEQWFTGASEPKPMPPFSQQMRHKERSLKATHANPAMAQDNRLPHIPYTFSTNPVTRFPKDQERRRRTTILVKLWLLISAFYRRASMNEDAKGAIEEAQKLVHAVELEVSKDNTGNVSIDQAGWAGGKSVGELWGDVFSERGHLAVAFETPYDALTNFESALTHFADHPAAIIGLSNILLDIYTEDLLPPPSIPQLVLPNRLTTPSASTVSTSTILNVTVTPLATQPPPVIPSSSVPIIPHGPLGLPPAKATAGTANKAAQDITSTPDSVSSGLQPSYKESSTALLDRLAARDRAYGLLTALTKLGTGWNCSEAWFVLARAYEESGQPDKAREVLWWCVELEEGRGVRDWSVVNAGGYVL